MTRPLALVTGGMRRLGAVIAARLAGAGYDLALTSHGKAALEAELPNDTKWRHFAADLSNPANAEALVADVVAHFGRVPDVLVNNAAMFGQDGWQEMDLASLEAHFRLNLFSPLLLAKACVERAAHQISIVHILDQRITNPNGDQLSYTLSKQALAASVRSLAVALGEKARVNGVAPGLVIPTEDYDSAQMESLAREMPLGALPDAAGVANAVAYLAEANHVTGQIIFVDGGANLKSFPRDFMHL
jgi:pteridine reductase